MADEWPSLELGLDLCLGVGRTATRQPPPAKPNIPSGYSLQPPTITKRNYLSDFFRSQIEGNEGTMIWRGVGSSEELRVASPNSAVSSSSGKRSERGNEIDEGEWSRGSDDDDAAAANDLSRKKLRLSKYQSLLLEDAFKDHSTLNPVSFLLLNKKVIYLPHLLRFRLCLLLEMQKLGLAKQLNLRPRQVEVWFQNRRARTKLKQTEVDCDYLKKCCERLSEENRRLQKEAQELRALKLSSQVYMHMNPPTTLTMCPSCEKIAVSASSAPSTSAQGLANPTDCVPRSPNALIPWPPVHIPL